MKRRNFIISAGLTSLVLPSLLYCTSKGSMEDYSNPDTLSNILDGKEIDHLGKRYIELVPGENDKKNLTKLLSSDIGDGTLEAIHNAITQEFKSGTTVQIEGWILSRIEARQCALYSLTT